MLGGLNVGFWPIGPVARRSGVVFIRRSVRDDPVYKLVLREYIGYLIRKRFNLEWYIEGGRTRDGQAAPPRYGLLNYLVEAFRDGAVEEVMLVPTSIVYDQLYEVGAMAAEEHGARQDAGEPSWLVGYARAQGRGFGTVRVGFGEPLSLREALGEQKREHAVERVGIEVCHRINRATPITETALVALALLGSEDRALTLDEVRATLDPLLEHVRVRSLPMLGDLDLGQASGVRQALDALCGHGVVRRYSGGIEPVWSITPERHLEAAFYRNSILHFFLNRAIAELVLVHVDEVPTPDPVEEGWREARRVRDLLKFEFFFAGTREFERELRAELAIIDPAWERRRPSRGPRGGRLRRRLCGWRRSCCPRSSRRTWSWPSGWPSAIPAPPSTRRSSSPSASASAISTGCRTDPEHRVDLARAVRERAAARGEPRPGRPEGGEPADAGRTAFAEEVRRLVSHRRLRGSRWRPRDDDRR